MGGGRLQELRPYWVKFCLIGIIMITAERLTPCFKCFIPVKSQFEKKSGTSQKCGKTTTPYYPISALLSVRWLLTGGSK